MTEKNYLKNYQKDEFEKLSLTVDILIFRMDDDFDLQLLLKKREDHPYKDFWALPGGFVGIEESIETAAKRVMLEKTGVSDMHMEQLYTFGDKDRDPRMRIVTVSYLLIMPRRSDYQAENDTDFFTVKVDGDRLNFIGKEHFFDEQLAFDHKKIISLALDRMRGKVDYTDLAFSFLKDKDKFTIYELQKVYEAIEQKEHDTPNFRRYFTNRFVKTGTVYLTDDVSTDFSKRPSKVYGLSAEGLENRLL